MKKAIQLIIVLFLLYACNNAKNNDPKNDSSQNENAYFLDSMQRLVKQFPDSTSLRLQYAFALDSLNNFKEALQQMDSLTTKENKNYGLWFAKGNIAEDAQDTLLAMESYTKALQVYESPDALLALANLYAETKNERTILLVSRVKNLGLGKDYDAHCAFILGVYYARTHKSAEAIKYFDECIAYSYTYMEAYIEKGLIYFDAKQYDKALQVFQFASTVNNLYADAYYYQARCYEMMNKKDSAVMNFKQAFQIDPTLKEAKKHIDSLEAK